MEPDTIEVLRGIVELLLIPIYLKLRSIDTHINSHTKQLTQHAEQIGYLKGVQRGNKP